MRCGVCNEERGTKHAERCRGPRLRQPVYAASDWAGLMADEDTDRLRADGGHDYGSGQDDIPAVGRH